MSKPACKVSDIVFIRFELTDLEAQKEYLDHFGMQLAYESTDSIYYKGAGGDPYIYVATKGQKNHYVSAAYKVESLEELEGLAAATGSKIQESQEPAGGHFVELADPDGLGIEVYFGMQEAACTDHTPPSLNAGQQKTRVNELQRFGKASEEWQMRDGEWRYDLRSKVLRLGHSAINVSDADKSIQWYAATLGMLISDNLLGPDGETRIGVFMRCDHGDLPVDHHTINIIQLPGMAQFDGTFGHAGFEVTESVDDLMAGHFHMKTTGKYVHEWGIGRHLLGSQMYDYWRDPQGFTLEHWTDGDLLDASVPPNNMEAKSYILAQYGPLVPATFNLSMPSDEVQNFRDEHPSIAELLKGPPPG